MILILSGAPLGLATGILAWFAAGGVSVGAERLDTLQTQISNLKPPARQAAAPGFISVADLASAPLFALTVGPGAVKEPAVRLEGLSLSKNRTAALISIDGGVAEWMAVGDVRAGVTLQRVTNSNVTIETVTGVKEVVLGGETAGVTSEVATPARAMAQAPVANTLDQIPPGFRSPPPPASAPGTP